MGSLRDQVFQGCWGQSLGSSRAGCSTQVPTQAAPCQAGSWGESEGKHVLQSEMNLLHLGNMEFGGMRPWGQKHEAHGLKVLAFAFCRISGMAVPDQQQDLSEKSWDLCGPGLVLRDWPPGAGGGAGAESKLSHFRKGRCGFQPRSEDRPRDRTQRSGKASQTRGGARTSTAAQPRSGSTVASEKH